MQRESNTWMSCHDFEERFVRALVGFLEDVVKISNGLMVVNPEGELNFRQIDNSILYSFV